MFTTNAEIHRAMQLPQCPPNLVLGINADDSKKKFVHWMDEIIRTSIKPCVDVRDRDGLGNIVPGSYSGLRSGEWGIVIQKLTTPAISLWHCAMLNAVPPVSCGRCKVADGIAGRGNNTSSFPAIGPFH